MTKFFCSLIFAASILSASYCTAQNSNSVVGVKEVERIENYLASDAMRGRKTGSPEIAKAAAFIADEFKKAGLQPLQGTSFLQEFSLVKPTLKSLKFNADGTDVDAKNVVVITTQSELEVTETSGYAVQQIKAGDTFISKAQSALQAKQNTIVLVDTSFAAAFPRLSRAARQQFKKPHSIVFILGNALPKTFSLKAEHSFDEMKLMNVVGQLRGKTAPKEQVVFSGHYDHIGVGEPAAGDSVFNGANDDAAGTTAVISLAKYFAKQKSNNRTLIFAAFTAEEIGGFGSQYFSQQLDPENVVAMFNIEMIGTESKWGRGSAYITGYEKTNMGEILQANLKGTGFTFYPDPYPQEQLFYRSDNATLARLGVPAHTISTSKMDNEPNYHKQSDEVKTLDLQNMAQIIKAIAQSSKTIISGKDTPSRVKVDSLQ